MSFQNIPDELKAIPNWILWRLVEVEDQKPTKEPINPHNGKLASVSNKSTWATFEQAVAVSQHASGIGFVLTADLNISCIDLDHTENTEIQERQQRIAKAFNSYSEISPSGKGLHIWCKGKVPSGKKKDFVEVYSAGRYMTFTGHVYNNAPVREYNDLLNQLWHEMGGKEQEVYNIESKAQLQSDWDILKAASEAVNGQKFIDLFEGRWQNYYPNDDHKKISCNEADASLVNIIAFYTQNHEQIARIFHASALGKRAKAKRQDYLFNSKYGLVIKALDKQLPPVDLDTLKNNLEAEFAEQQLKQTITQPEQPVVEQPIAEQIVVKKPISEQPVVEKSIAVSEQVLQYEQAIALNPNSAIINFVTGTPVAETVVADKTVPDYPPVLPVLKCNNEIYNPPQGLVGELAKFIYAASARPVPEIALAASIGLMAGICGRCYNVSGTGLNQYILLLAATGTGKEASHSGIDKIMSYVKQTVPACLDFIGPGEIASPQALIKYMSKKSKCFVSLVGEFGLMLKQICSPRANPNHIGIRRVMLELFNKSGKNDSYKPIIYSDKDKNTEYLDSPAFSILGESTPERFYETLTDEMIYEGLLPRFTVIEYKGNRPQLNKDHLKAVMPQRLVDQISQLCAYALQLNNGNNVIDVQLSDKALQLMDNFNVEVDAHINSALNEITRHLWNRAHIKALKLASLLAVGNHYLKPTVTEAQAMWAIKVVTQDVNTMLAKYENGEIGAPQIQNEQHEELKKAFRKYLIEDWSKVEGYAGSTQITHFNKIVPHSFITAFCRNKICFKNDKLGPVQAIKTNINSLIESGEIQEVSLAVKQEKMLPKNGKIYAVSNAKWLR